jgi:DnaJ-class molecular chaperone|tara:strand:- start:309 stop:476 length:168 start_codon:yes stop_codon:yes gene_type:complete
MKICDQCHGNGYISVIAFYFLISTKSYIDCPRCNSQGEINEENMETPQTQRELGE